MPIDTPMVPQAAMATLACARICAVHSVAFGGFAAHELATRIDAVRLRVIGRPRAASRSISSSPTSRCSTRRSPRRAHSPSIA